MSRSSVIICRIIGIIIGLGFGLAFLFLFMYAVFGFFHLVGWC